MFKQVISNLDVSSIWLLHFEWWQSNGIDFGARGPQRHFDSPDIAHFLFLCESGVQMSEFHYSLICGEDPFMFLFRCIRREWYCIIEVRLPQLRP